MKFSDEAILSHEGDKNATMFRGSDRHGERELCNIHFRLNDGATARARVAHVLAGTISPSRLNLLVPPHPADDHAYYFEGPLRHYADHASGDRPLARKRGVLSMRLVLEDDER
jgi:hypothetical protein